MHRLILLFLTLLLPTSPLSATELSPTETVALLKSLQEHRAKSPSFIADFTEQKTSHLLTTPLTSQGSIAFQIPNKFRREVKGSTPSITVSNGEKLWIYYPAFKEVELYSIGQRQFFDDAIAALTAGLNFQAVEKFYSTTAAREPDGFRLTLTPKSAALRKIIKDLTIFTDPDGKIQRTDATLAKGDLLSTTYKNHRPTPLPPSTFDFTPPPDSHTSQPLGK
ncbi:MAG: outer membrane lipoprotein carrier protein LolA [Verrucomicrobia bacterium]|nr:outer membrane lipoprotein carrier protein LolA [Verrucomicrobiota bacterium]